MTHAEYMRNWRRNNPEKVIEIRRRHYQKNRRRILDGNKEYSKQWFRRNPDKLRKYQKTYFEKNKELVRKRKREYMRRYVRRTPQDKEKRRATIRRWYWKHRDEIRMKAKKWLAKTGKGKQYNRIYNGARRSLDLFAENCKKKIEILMRERFCHWCCTPLNKSNLEIDHVIPLSRGGLHVPDNLVASCSFCNSSRCNKLIQSEWEWELAA